MIISLIINNIYDIIKNVFKFINIVYFFNDIININDKYIIYIILY